MFQINRLIALLVILISYCFSENVRGGQIVVWHQKMGATAFLETMLAPLAPIPWIYKSLIFNYRFKTALIKAVINQNEPNIAIVPSDFLINTKH